MSSSSIPTRNRASTVEIRPGEGGADAALFAAELAQAINNWCRRNNAGAEIESGPRSQIVQVNGDLDMSWLSGTHRIMRIPPGDAHGRRHTSSVTVVVLGAFCETNVELCDDDFDMETYRASGAGGQHRNKTDSAVRLTHRASGLVVCCADNRSQYRNLADARTELARRLNKASRANAADGRNDVRVSQFTSGGTTARTYTWNEQRDEVTSGDGRKIRMRDAFAGRLDKLVG